MVLSCALAPSIHAGDLDRELSVLVEISLHEALIRENFRDVMGYMAKKGSGEPGGPFPYSAIVKLYADGDRTIPFSEADLEPNAPPFQDKQIASFASEFYDVLKSKLVTDISHSSSFLLFRFEQGGESCGENIPGMNCRSTHFIVGVSTDEKIRSSLIRQLQWRWIIPYYPDQTSPVIVNHPTFGSVEPSQTGRQGTILDPYPLKDIPYHLCFLKPNETEAKAVQNSEFPEMNAVFEIKVLKGRSELISRFMGTDTKDSSTVSAKSRLSQNSATSVKLGVYSIIPFSTEPVPDYKCHEIHGTSGPITIQH